MSFGDLFPVDPPEPEPEPAIQHEQPEWFGPPSGELPVAVPFGVVLGRSPRGVVALSHALVHSTGVQFQVVAHVDGLGARRVEHDLPRTTRRPDGSPGAAGAVFCASGSNCRTARASRTSPKEAGGVLRRRKRPARCSGSPAAREAAVRPARASTGASGYWLWPLPDAGVLRLFCEWPVAELELASAEIDAAPIREAAGAVTRLWPRGRPGAVDAWRRQPAERLDHVVYRDRDGRGR